MKKITPLRVLSAKAISNHRQTNEIVRVLDLGLFDISITPQSIIDAISNEKLYFRISSRDSDPSNVFFNFEIVEISDGVIYDNIDEFVHHLKFGIHYQDVIMGYNYTQ